MSDFHELDLPKEAYLGWYILSLFGINEYLHDDGKIHQGCADAFYQSSGYFTSEHEAHKAAERYYLKNGRKYPYTKLLNDVFKNVNDGSQVMNFLGDV